MVKFSELQLSRQYRHEIKPFIAKKILGFDTETYNTGDAFLIACSDGNYSFDRENFLKWMFKYEDSINFFYNADFDVRAILKIFLSKENFMALYKTGSIEFEGFKIRYLQHKFLSLSIGKHVVIFYDLCQYFHISLEKAAKKYSIWQKQEMETKNFNKSFVALNRERILSYCIMDARICGLLGEYMNYCFKPLGGFHKPISNAYISEYYFKQNVAMPDFLKIPYNVLEAAYNSYHGGRFEVIKRGCFENVSCYDINSAYPAEYLNLVDYTQGKWQKSKIPSEHGFYLAKIKFNKSWIYPHPANMGSLKIYPRHVAGWVTGDEMLYYQSNNLIEEIKVIKGYEWQGKKIYPLRDCVNFLYGERQKSEAKKYAIKIILNSIYGKFIQKTPSLIKSDYNDFDYFDRATGIFYRKVWKTGQLFNPCWAAEVTAGARLKLYDAAVKYNALAMATDSILTEKRMSESSGLGGWKCERSNDKAIILGSGMYQLGEGKGFVSKHRGIYTKTSINDLIKANIGKEFIKVMMYKPKQLGESLLGKNNKAFSLLNSFQESEKKININFDKKRVWSDKWNKCSEIFDKVIESAPIEKVI